MAFPESVSLVPSRGKARRVSWAAAAACQMIVDAFEHGAGDGAEDGAGGGAEDGAGDSAGDGAGDGAAGTSTAPPAPSLPVPVIAAGDLNAVVAALESFAAMAPELRAVGAAAAALTPGRGRRGDRGRLAAFCAAIQGVPPGTFRSAGPKRLPALVRALDYLQADAPLALLLISKRKILRPPAPAREPIAPGAAAGGGGARVGLAELGPILEARLPAVRTRDSLLFDEVPAAVCCDLPELAALAFDGAFEPGDGAAEPAAGAAEPAAGAAEPAAGAAAAESAVGTLAVTLGRGNAKFLKSPTFAAAVASLPSVRRLCLCMRTEHGWGTPLALFGDTADGAPRAYDEIVLTVGSVVKYFDCASADLPMTVSYDIAEIFRAALRCARRRLTLVVAYDTATRDRVCGFPWAAREFEEERRDPEHRHLGFVLWAARVVAEGVHHRRGAGLEFVVDLSPVYFMWAGFADLVREALAEVPGARLRAAGPHCALKKDQISVADFAPGAWDTIAVPEEEWNATCSYPGRRFGERIGPDILPPPISVPVVFYGQHGEPLWEFVPRD